MIVVLALCTCLTATGCSRRTKRQMKYGSLDKALRVALPEDLSRSSPDDRREAVARLAEGGDYARDEVFHVLDAVARTDPAAQIRCVAIRGLARYKDDRPVGTMLAVLQAAKAGDKALPADADLRWEALQALAELDQRKALAGSQRELARDLSIRMAEFDPSRNVRITATEMLGCFKDREVLSPLIRLVREKDFAIAERAELSLIGLTGTTHDFDADAWEAWVAKTPDPFAKAGQIPQTTRPAPPSWFEKQERAIRRALRLGGWD
jgi:HEAT repeat protein